MKVTFLVQTLPLLLFLAVISRAGAAPQPPAAVPESAPPPPSAPGMPAALAYEVAEYKAKREEGISRLAEAAKAQLKTVQEAQMKAGRLEAANALEKAMAALPITSLENAAPPEGLPAQALPILKDHITKVFTGIGGLNRLFIPRMDKVKTDLLKAGDLVGANLAEAQSRELKEEAGRLAPEKAVPAITQGREEMMDNFTVEALIDGATELHVTKEGLYWVVAGTAAKPGLHAGSKEATYINGTRWKPEWRQKGERGPDASEVFPLKTTSPKLVCETVLVSRERFGKSVDTYTPVLTLVKDGHFIVNFRDPEMGSRWYKVRIQAVP